MYQGHHSKLMHFCNILVRRMGKAGVSPVLCHQIVLEMIAFQVIRARFGRRTHVVFCVFGLMTNVIVTAMLMLGEYPQYTQRLSFFCGKKYATDLGKCGA